jgi:hypothetical protein
MMILALLKAYVLELIYDTSIPKDLKDTPVLNGNLIIELLR